MGCVVCFYSHFLSLEQPYHVCVRVHTYCSKPKYVQSSKSQWRSVGLSVSQPQLSHTGVGTVSYRTHTRPSQIGLVCVRHTSRSYYRNRASPGIFGVPSRINPLSNPHTKVTKSPTVSTVWSYNTERVTSAKYNLDGCYFEYIIYKTDNVDY